MSTKPNKPIKTYRLPSGARTTTSPKEREALRMAHLERENASLREIIKQHEKANEEADAAEAIQDAVSRCIHGE